MLNLENIVKSYGGKKVLSGVSMTIPDGVTALLSGMSGSGKTTLLRSCIRALSENRQRVAVVDERLELAGAVHGVPQFDLGPCTDVLSGCPKGEGMLMLLRGMNPQWLAVDEITQPEDLAAIRLRRQAACDDPRRFC